MRRVSVLVTCTAGLALLVGGCASADAQAQVDEFCTQVEQLVRKANQFAKNPANTALGNEVTATGQQLIEQAPGLATVVATNPALAPRLQECTSQLQNIGGIDSGNRGNGN
jgi:outer membrane murein-binding lipoprotein Lpp